MVLLEQLLPDVKHYATAVPDLIAIRELRNAAAEFFDRSFYWKERQIFTSAGDGAFEFTLTLPPETRLNRIEAVRTKYHEYTGATEVTFSPDSRDYKYIANDTGAIEITPALKNGEELTIVFSVTPKRNANEIPESAYEEFGEAIAHGAAGRLLAMPERQWSSPQSVSYHIGMFNSGVSEATRRAQAAKNRVVRVSRFSW